MRWLGRTAFLAATMSLAACGPDICDADRPGVENALASAEAWLRVVDLPDGVPEGDGTMSVEMSVVPVGPRRTEGRARRESFEVHDSFAEDIESGLDAGADVYLALISVGSRKEQVGNVLVRDEGGVYTLGGACRGGDMAFLQDELDDADAVLDRVVGLTDRDRILRLLTPTATSGSTSAS